MSHVLVRADYGENEPPLFYGPFSDMVAAVRFMDEEYPDGDTDLSDMVADVYPTLPAIVNSPESVLHRS